MRAQGMLHRCAARFSPCCLNGIKKNYKVKKMKQIKNHKTKIVYKHSKLNTSHDLFNIISIFHVISKALN